ncbi:hypothetical protein [Methanoculleus sp. 10]|uniref:hypothetical protein n=1 Tax=Methanoculleus sp. 10 TaxID=430615 RepID=UPI0025DB8CD8|nr:hypothetical protein [Methanoculleus sp. 10]
MELLDRATSIRERKSVPSTRAGCEIKFNHFIRVLPLAFEGIETESDEAKLEIAVLLEGVI